MFHHMRPFLPFQVRDKSLPPLHHHWKNKNMFLIDNGLLSQYVHNFSENFETYRMQVTLYPKILTGCLKETVSLVKNVGVPTNLDQRQANDLQDWSCLHENSSVFSFTCMDDILNLMEDDIIYNLNDYVFCEQCTKLGK